jgi:peptidoglycan hydrolase-like protein with peptidoglycan-binding domain
MEAIKLGDSGAAVEDVQTRLSKIEVLLPNDITGYFDKKTEEAISRFCQINDIRERDYVDDEVWGYLVDASYSLGDRTLYLRAPHFTGADVKQLQKILGTLGFSCGEEDGIFGTSTEWALRQFQQNMGLPSDGICGAYTYQSIKNLHHSWEGKSALAGQHALSFARAAKVLESNKVVLFGTDGFTRSVAKRMSNLSLATTPASKIVSADALSVPPTEDMLLFEIKLGSGEASNSLKYIDDETLTQQMAQSINIAMKSNPHKMCIELEKRSWLDAGEERSAQHYAINLLDALCTNLA